jgi:hypothetical protein
LKVREMVRLTVQEKALEKGLGTVDQKMELALAQQKVLRKARGMEVPKVLPKVQERVLPMVKELGQQRVQHSGTNRCLRDRPPKTSLWFLLQQARPLAVRVRRASTTSSLSFLLFHTTPDVEQCLLFLFRKRGFVERLRKRG